MGSSQVIKEFFLLGKFHTTFATRAILCSTPFLLVVREGAGDMLAAFVTKVLWVPSLAAGLVMLELV